MTNQFLKQLDTNDYKQKYLKYKNKYLALKETLEGGSAMAMRSKTSPKSPFKSISKPPGIPKETSSESSSEKKEKYPVNVRLYKAAFKKMANSRGPCSPLTYKSTVETFNKKSVKDAQSKVKPELWTEFTKAVPDWENKTLGQIRGSYKCTSVVDKAKKHSIEAVGTAAAVGAAAGSAIEKNTRITRNAVGEVGKGVGDVMTQNMMLDAAGNALSGTASSVGSALGSVGSALGSLME